MRQINTTGNFRMTAMCNLPVVQSRQRDSSRYPGGRACLREAKAGEGFLSADTDPSTGSISLRSIATFSHKGRRKAASAAVSSSPLRRRQRLHDLLKLRQRFAARGVQGQHRIAHLAEQLRMRFAREAQRAGRRNIGVSNALAEPVGTTNRGALLFQ